MGYIGFGVWSLRISACPAISLRGYADLEVFQGRQYGLGPGPMIEVVWMYCSQYIIAHDNGNGTSNLKRFGGGGVDCNQVSSRRPHLPSMQGNKP